MQPVPGSGLEGLECRARKHRAGGHAATPVIRWIHDGRPGPCSCRHGLGLEDQDAKVKFGSAFKMSIVAPRSVNFLFTNSIDEAATTTWWASIPKKPPTDTTA